MNCLTFDVEEHFQVSAFDSLERRRQWNHLESRVARNTERLLQLLTDKNVRATFFVLGWVAERYPEIVRAISGLGHEVACHGFAHEVIAAQSPAGFRADIRRAKGILEDITGNPVVGYRAPSFTITRQTTWALAVLAEEGYQYDSSIFPILHDRYGIPGANPRIHPVTTDAGPLWEVPPTTVLIAGIRVPVAGGGYFRLFPYPIFRRLLKKVASEQPLVLYFHPWEVDPHQPRMDGPLLSRFRHYLNLEKTFPRLARLLSDFSFAPVGEVLRVRAMARFEGTIEAGSSPAKERSEGLTRHPG